MIRRKIEIFSGSWECTLMFIPGYQLIQIQRNEINKKYKPIAFIRDYLIKKVKNLIKIFNIKGGDQGKM